MAESSKRRTSWWRRWWPGNRGSVAPALPSPGIGPLPQPRFQLGFDAKTCFPCLRLTNGPWLQLLPVTKLQVEQWIAEGGLADLPDAGLVTQLVRRMEQPEAGELYPATVIASRRTVNRQLSSENLVSVLATNLSLWSDPQELESAKSLTFPTPTSEWGRFLKWFQADVPSAADSLRLREQLSGHTTRVILQAVTRVLPVNCPGAVRRLLQAVTEAVDPTSYGLPFAESGIWEVVREVATDTRMNGQRGEVKVHHPHALGRTALWPYLPTETTHVLTYPELPMVGQRLSPRYVTSSVQFEVLRPPRVHRAPPRAGDVRQTKLTPAVAGPNTMESRCPLCYELVPRELWRSAGNVYCSLVKTQDGNRVSTERVHTPERPRNMRDRTWVEVSCEVISADYRNLARQFPELVRPICVSGYSQEGKTCFLLSLAGILRYPDGNNLFGRIFPAEVGLRRTWGELAPLAGANNVSLPQSLEQLWIEGLLPPPTPIKRALASPLIFRTAHNAALATIIHDVAGEAMGPEIAHHPEFPHVACSRDFIYVQRATDIRHCCDQFERFVAGLRVGTFEKRQIDSRERNLVFAVSQMDRLQPGDEPDQELLRICLQHPYLAPNRRESSEFREYIAGMQWVHHALRDYLLRKSPDLVMHAEEQFGSVRYCAFSAFGHHPLPAEFASRPDCNGCLVAAPRPVRVVDPLLWILRDQGVFHE